MRKVQIDQGPVRNTWLRIRWHIWFARWWMRDRVQAAGVPLVWVHGQSNAVGRNQPVVVDTTEALIGRTIKTIAERDGAMVLECDDGYWMEICAGCAQGELQWLVEVGHE